MPNSIKGDGYNPPGVIAALHWHKRGQRRSARRSLIAIVLIGALLVSVGSVLLHRSSIEGDVSVRAGGYETAGREAGRRIREGLASEPAQGGAMPLPGNFPAGYLGEIHIVHDELPYPAIGGPYRLPELSGVVGPAVSEGSDPESYQPADGPDLALTPDDYGLPPEQPMWTYNMGGPGSFLLPAMGFDQVIDRTPVARPPHAILANPAWPREAEFFFDTAVVDGWVVLHSTGRMTFELSTESPRRMGFAREVERAVARSTCYPAVDDEGDRYTVRCRYRCVFVQGNRPEVFVSSEREASRGGGGVTATLMR